MATQLSPAHYVIQQFGGVHALARLLDVHASTVCRWRMPKSKRGTGGVVPPAWYGQILALAKKRGLDIRPEDLVLGRKGRRAA